MFFFGWIQSTGQASTQAVSFVPMQGSAMTKAIGHLRVSVSSQYAGDAVQAGGMCVRAVTLGTYRCTAFLTDYWPRHEGFGSSPVGIHYGSPRSAGACRNGLFWICRECAETCTWGKPRNCLAEIFVISKQLNLDCSAFASTRSIALRTVLSLQ